MTINSFNPEFGYELISVLPYAYWLHKQGLLTKTISAKGTEPLYYFSPKHEIDPSPRSWFNGGTTAVYLMVQAGIPNAVIHKPKLDTDRFLPPPYKNAYANDWAKFKKPMFVIYNRYNNEWPGRPELNKPINYFSLELLDRLFTLLKPKYDILYCNIEGQTDLYDNAPPIKIKDYELCLKHGVTHIKDLLIKHSGLSYNQIQLYYFANCDRFLTMNGGGSILASYFGGQNIIYTKYCKELECGDFSYYHLFGGSI